MSNKYIYIKQLLQLEVAGSYRRLDDSGLIGVSAAGSKPGSFGSKLQKDGLRVVLALRPALHKVHRSLQETRRLLRLNRPSSKKDSSEGNARKYYN